MSIDERAKAAAKDVEGKVQEGVGNVTGDTEDKAKGKAKQTEADMRNTKEDVKDDIKRKTS